MFFNRKQCQTTATPDVLTGAARTDGAPSARATAAGADAKWQVAGRRALALGMAVQLALPVAGIAGFAQASRAAGPVATGGKATGGMTFGTVNGSDAALRQLFGTGADGSAAGPALSASVDASVASAFAGVIDQLRAGDYEAAAKSLISIPTSTLSEADNTRIDETLVKARAAAKQQQKARAELSVAQQAAGAGHAGRAVTHYQAAGANAFADADTRQQASDGIARLTAGATAAPAIHADMLAIEQDAAPATAPTTAPAVAGDATPPPAPAAVPPAPAPAPAPVVVAPAPAVAVPTDEQSAAQNALSGAANYQKIKQQLQQYQAQKLVDKAKVEYQANQKQEALNDYTEAAKLDPDNREAVVGRDEVASALGVGVRAQLVKTQSDINVRIQQIQYEFNSDLNKANENIAAKKFADAQRNIDSARVARNLDPTLFTTQQLNEFDTNITNTQVALKTAQVESQNAENVESSKKVQQNEAARQRQFDLDKQNTVAGLIQSARQYQEQGLWRQALAAIDQIQAVDPTNQYAAATRQMVLDRATAAEQREYREKFDREFEKVLNAADEKQIPYSDIVHYSDDWPTLSEMRDKEVAADRGEGDADAALQAQLDRHLPEVRFNANALSDVIDFLRDVTGANIYVDWKALEAASIARDAPVTARLRDVKFSKALDVIFKSVNGDDDEHKLGYTIDEGVITISTRKELNKNTTTRRYDINDLLFVAPDYNQAPQLDISQAGQSQSAGSGGGGTQSSNLFQGGQQNQNQQNQQNNREQRIDEIKQYIQQNVDANSWKDAGGETGTISSSPLRAILLITQTPENQRKIVSVLDSLRASQALQVSIETRFLTVQRNFLEDIGVDADMTFNPLTDPSNPRSGYNSSRFSPITITQNQVTDNTTFLDANGNVVANASQGARQLDWASAVGNAAIPGSIPANPADYPNPIVIRGTYLDNLTVSFLIRAVEANQHTTQLTAPRLTLFSGQRSVLIVETQQAYVSSLTPIVAPGAALFQPQVSTTVATGVVLSVQATVSPDRKYVYLDLQPQLARLRALTSFTLSAVVQQQSTVVGGAATNQIIQGTLQLPTIDVTQVFTSVSVPDGATLLLGGQTLAGETTREQGVPVLSKIPFIKRLFTNRANAQDENILLILVKPTILIQREQEQKQFPQLSSKLNSTGN